MNAECIHMLDGEVLTEVLTQQPLYYVLIQLSTVCTAQRASWALYNRHLI